VDVALPGRASVPGHRGRGIDGNALPALVHEAHQELGGGVSALREGMPLAVRGVVVTPIVRPPAVLEAGPGRAGGQQGAERDARERRGDASDQAISG